MGFWVGKKTVVVGGAGFIGSYLVEYLVERGAAVTVLDSLETGRPQNLSGIASEIEFVQGDVTEMGLARSVFAGQEVVMNLAASAPGVGLSHAHHVDLLGRNVQVGAVALEAARQAGVRRFLVVSSSCVYPDDAPVPTPELSAFTGEPERVNSGYGWAKRFLELQARHYAKHFGMEIAVARPFNAYGARDIADGERSHVIPAIIARLMSEDPELVVWGDGTQTRSFIHARDVAAGLALLTERYAVCDPVNVGHDRETSMKQLVRLLTDITGIRKEVVYDVSKPVGCRRKSADMTKFRRVTGVSLDGTDLRDGLREMVDAHMALAGV